VVDSSPSTDLDTLAGAVAAARAGEVSPTELVEQALTRHELLGKRLNCHTTILFDEAFVRARELEALGAAERSSLALYGIPVSVKDCLATAGIPTSIGSPILRDSRPREDARAVQRLKEAGAIVVAKDNMYDFAYCGPNAAFGDVTNPWGESLTTGGSSSGSAAAVASEVSFAALGTDGGGSIRIPSAYCGTVGLKPTFDVVSGVGELPVQGSLSCVGPIARNVGDVSLVFGAIAEKLEAPLDIDAGARGLRIGVPSNLDDSDSAVRGLFETACARLAEEGAIVEHVGPLNFEAARAAMWIITGVEYAEALRPYLRHRPQDMHPLTRTLLERAEFIPATEYVHAQRSRVALCREMAQTMQNVDVLLLPTVPTAAYPSPAEIESAAEAADHPVNMSTIYTALFNVTGQPAATLPCGLTASGLPIGLQVVGRPYAENSVLRAARAYERVSPFAGRHAPLSVSTINAVRNGSTAEPGA
jgi:aspartyl-tRNA(Asn)/glutamyl-tRNA(Gln) amidotransferase subunit A